MTHQEDEIPLMDDFSESSLLDQISNKKEEEEGETDEEREAREAQEEADRLAEEEKLAEDEAARLAAEEQEEENDENEEEENEEEENEEEGSFWEDVEAITGNKVEIDFGDVDPNTPEGAALREEAVIKKGIEENLAALEAKYPESFKFLTHEANGGKISDLINVKQTNYSSITLDENNTEQLKSVLKDYYMSKGLSEAKAVRNVEDDEDSDEGLFENAKLALKEQQEAEATQEAKVLEEAKKAKEDQLARDQEFSKTLSETISAGKIGNFNVPKKEAEEFYNYVLSHVQRTNNGYALAMPLEAKNLESQLQQMFFGYKKGDLSKYVTNAAKTANAKTLKRNLKKDKDGTESASEGTVRKGKKKLPTMGSFEV